jgi:ABC-type transport system substrate-binding protein
MPLIDSLWRADSSGFARHGLVAAVVAAVATVALASSAAAATRPRYGGTLRVEVREPGESADPPQTGHLAEPAGAFHMARWEPGRRAVYEADENAAGGRPFLDSIEIVLGRPPREQALALELGKTDVADAGAGEARRLRRTWTSAPVRLLALVVSPRVNDARVRQALALAIDRAAIHSTLLQRQGEVAGGLLPQWLSGYAFLFPTAPDLDRARALVAHLTASGRTFSLGYDNSEPQARAIAERVALNARDAGLLVSVAPNAHADVRLLEASIRSLDPAQALAGVAAALGQSDPARTAGADALYQAENALLESWRVIPLLHLPEVYGVGPRVRTWLVPGVGELGGWRFENVWLEARP